MSGEDWFCCTGAWGSGAAIGARPTWLMTGCAVCTSPGPRTTEPVLTRHGTWWQPRRVATVRERQAVPQVFAWRDCVVTHADKVCDPSMSNVAAPPASVALRGCHEPRRPGPYRRPTSPGPRTTEPVLTRHGTWWHFCRATRRLRILWNCLAFTYSGDSSWLPPGTMSGEDFDIEGSQTLSA
jgi:hypothetical protein